MTCHGLGKSGGQQGALLELRVPRLERSCLLASHDASKAELELVGRLHTQGADNSGVCATTSRAKHRTDTPHPSAAQRSALEATSARSTWVDRVAAKAW